MKVTRKSKRLLSILFVFLLPSHLFSQAASMPMEASTEGEPVTEVQEDETDEGGNRTIKGIIYDEQGETIIGASVLIKGEETTGTTSDMDGKFTLSVPQGSTLVISYIGYHPQEIKIRKRRILYRYIKQRLGLEKCNYMPNMKMLKNMYKWTSEFENNKINFEKDLFRYEEKLTILQSKGKIKKYVNGDGSI